MTPKKAAFETAAKTLITQLEKRGMEGHYFNDARSCKKAILESLPSGSSIAWGGSETIKEIGLFEALSADKYDLIDRFSGSTPEEGRALYAKSVLADFFLMSANAVTLDGELVNVDGRGNRVACLIHGPKNVIVVVGMNKLVTDVREGINRARNFAAPPNAKRLERKTPCQYTGRCGDCLSEDCMCCQIVVTRKSIVKGRIKVYLVAQDLGY